MKNLDSNKPREVPPLVTGDKAIIERELLNIENNAYNLRRGNKLGGNSLLRSVEVLRNEFNIPSPYKADNNTTPID